MIYAFGPFELDARRFELRRGGEIVPLQRRAFDLLLHLVRHAGVVCTREQLRVDVWDGVVVTKDAMAHAALAVRTALEDDEGVFVRTVRGRGYSFVGTVATKNVDDPLVGRAAIMATFYDRLARACRGEGSFIWLRGEIGAGKTRLLEELASHEAGMRTVIVPAKRTGNPHPVLRRLFEETAPESRCDPIVVAFDDIDEADPESVGLVLALCRRVPYLPAVVLATTTRGSRGGDLGSHGLSPIDLEPLTRDQIAAYAERSLHTRLGRAVVDLIHAESNGNPLFVRALMRGLSSDEGEAIVARLRRRVSDQELRALAEWTRGGRPFVDRPGLERARALGLTDHPALARVLRDWLPPDQGGHLAAAVGWRERSAVV
jgi:DNA-binding winged helix-turn-helix (wHTH) protein